MRPKAISNIPNETLGQAFRALADGEDASSVWKRLIQPFGMALPTWYDYARCAKGKHGKGRGKR